MYNILVEHVDDKALSFWVDDLDLSRARALEVQLNKRFPAFDGYRVTVYEIERTLKPVCL